MNLSLLQISEWTAGERSPGVDSNAIATGYSIDSRTLERGDLFFAVKGDRFDGHDFVEAALSRGAVAAVIAKSQSARFAQSHAPLILVDDTLTALQHLASAVRRRWGKRVIGITGSAGKTTTKEAIATVLERKFNVLKSKGNLNNAFGMPLQLLRLEPAHDIAVIEIGMSFAGEIRSLAELARPDLAVITNVAPVHVGNFPDGIAGVARAKYELIEALPRGGVAFLNCDDHYVGQFGRDCRCRAVYFGTGVCADPRAEEIVENGTGVSFTAVTMRAGAAMRTPVKLSLLGKHNVFNALAAIAVGIEAGMTPAEAAETLSQLKPADKRGERVTIAGATILNDCYNSNPRALDSMVDALMAIEGTRHIVVAGEMLELGAGSKQMHMDSGNWMARQGVNIVVGVRGDAKYIVDSTQEGGVESLFVTTPEEAGTWLSHNLRAGDVVLLKASRGVQLERALKVLEVARGDSSHT
jgi:UDP-N-acetylmuramoyl-tripeptide--D-alanyl-D-alanine ligase